MNVLTRTTAFVTAGALLAAPAALLIASPAQADTQRSGACGQGRYEFSVDREDRGFELSADLDFVEPGSSWKVVLRHEGKTILSRTVRADAEGDLDVEAYRQNTKGKDTFAFRATRVGTSTSCGAKITVS
ncbi:MAG: hypothetical protein F2667_02545 [Actinobacteria bacterium]|uniref:Unannotated protein n=1 Tax=freshwater metagenome TaxID=449393 RepID=A0A6J6REX0_9ZZZZ|nr:hypothetical protein [Actinomycetota bacterium]